MPTVMRNGEWMEIPTPRVNKRVLVERLQKAGLLEAAFQALGGPGAYAYERWGASVEVDPENPDVIGLLTAIGADLAVMLRPGESV